MEFDFLSFCLYIYIYTRISGASPRNFFGGGGGGYVNLGPFILDNIRTLVKALQKTKEPKIGRLIM